MSLIPPSSAVEFTAMINEYEQLSKQPPPHSRYSHVPNDMLKCMRELTVNSTGIPVLADGTPLLDTLKKVLNVMQTDPHYYTLTESKHMAQGLSVIEQMVQISSEKPNTSHIAKKQLQDIRGNLQDTYQAKMENLTKLWRQMNQHQIYRLVSLPLMLEMQFELRQQNAT